MHARIADTEINYDLRGRGQPLLFLHAFPLDSAMWDEAVAACRGDWQCVRFDARGFGGTSPGDGPLTMERIAGDADALLDHLQLSDAVVVGCSMGGYAALALHRLYPRRVRALVLCDTRAEADTDEGRAGRAKLAAEVRAHGAIAAADAMLPKLVGATTHAERPDVVARVRASVLAAAPQAIIHGLEGMAARADATPHLKAIRVPTLVMCGGEDVLTPPSASQALHAGIAGSRLAILPDAGHLSMLEDPQAFAAKVGAFLDELRQGS